MKKVQETRDVRCMFSIGLECNDKLDYLVGRYKAADGSLATTRSNAIRKIIRAAYDELKASEAKMPKKKPVTKTVKKTA